MGALVSPVCYFFLSVIKGKLGIDDALDAFGCHGVGGILGGILTGIFADPKVGGETGLIFGGGKLFLAQIEAIAFTVVFAGVATYIIIRIIKLFIPIRVTTAEEAAGLDLTQHDETAYPTFMGLDS
jgi:Amt family ammonium transporter